MNVEELSLPPLVIPEDVPFWDQPWIEPELEDLLYGAAGEQQLHTYFIVDATLRTSVSKMFDLDVLPVPTLCLYQGAAAKDYAESAPYLIDLAVPETGPTTFHRSFFADHWDKGTGIALRSTASLTEVRGHFRRFTRAEGTDGRSMFFRFWEANVMHDYFEAVSQLPLRARDLFQMRGGHWIEAIIGHADAVGRTCVVRPDKAALDGLSPSPSGIQLDQTEEAALYRGVLRRHAKTVERSLTDLPAGQDAAQREALVFDCLLRMRHHGILRLDHLAILAAWDVAAGGQFEAGDPQAADILRAPIGAEDKITRLKGLRPSRA